MTNKTNKIIKITSEKTNLINILNNNKNSYLNQKDVTVNTLITYTKAIQKMADFLVNTNNINTNNCLLNFKNYLINNYATSTINLLITCTKNYLKYLKDNNLIKNINLNIKQLKTSNLHKKKPLEANNIKDINVNLGSEILRNKLIYKILLTTGARQTEIFRANVQDIQTLNGETILYIQGKGRNDKSDFLILSREIAKDLNEYIKDKKDLKKPLFTSNSNNSNGNRLTLRSIRNIVKNLFKKSGITDPKITTHSLRHTAITNLLKLNKKIDHVKEFARHKNINTTMVYNHTINKFTNKFEDILYQKYFM